MQQAGHFAETRIKKKYRNKNVKIRQEKIINRRGGAAFGSREWLLGPVLANRWAESQLSGNSFGAQLCGTTPGISFGE
jgi:hypothetical protein